MPELEIQAPTPSSGDGVATTTTAPAPPQAPTPTVEPEAPPAAPSPAPVPYGPFASKDEADDFVRRHSAAWGHDEWKAVDSYNRNIARGQARIREEHAREVAEQGYLSRLQGWFANLTADQYRAIMQADSVIDPATGLRAREADAKLHQFQARGGALDATRDAIERNIVSDLRAALSNDDAFKGVVENWDELVELSGLEFLKEILTRSRKDRDLAAEHAADAKYKARYNERLREHGLSLEEPEQLPPVSGPPPSYDGILDSSLSTTAQKIAAYTAKYGFPPPT